MKKMFFFFSTILCVTAYCGKLEDFADDFNDVVKHARTVEQLDSKARYRDDFKLKLFRLQADAADIQLVATQIGIRDITIGTDVKEYIGTINIDKKGKIKRERYESRSFAIRDIRKQINYLKNLRFSVEKRTFVPNRHYLEDLNVQIRFTRRWDHCKKIAFSKSVLSPYAVREYQKRYFNEIQRLSRLIDQHVRRENLKISDRFQLTHNVDRFVSAWKINTSHFEATRKRNNDNNHSGDYRSTPEVDARIKEMELLAEEIEKDLNYLAEAGFLLYLKDKRFTEEQLKAMRKRFGMDKGAAKEKVSANKKRADEAVPVTPKKKVNGTKVVKMYNERKNRIYDSESKMNGVSQSYYNKYKALLPAKQKTEMDAEMKKLLNESYPAALARSTAVKMIHLKYGGNNHGCSTEELMKLMKITPGDVK